MGNPRNFTTKFNANIRQMEAALKAAGVTKRKRPALIERAASGRPADLAAQARGDLADRRVKASIDMIAGTA